MERAREWGRRLLARARAAADGPLEAAVRAALAPRRDAQRAVEAEHDAARTAIIDLEHRVRADLARLDPRPVGRATTVHAAHHADPRVGAWFAAHGLPACLACAVGADETLEEAASAEGVDLGSLLAILGDDPRA